MVAAAVVAGGAALGGAYMASSSAKDAAKTQANAARDAQNQEMAMYQQNREDMMPWLDQGKSALSQLGYLTGTSGNTNGTDVNTSMGGYGSLAKPFGTSDFNADPGYQFRLSEGQKALDRSMAAKGGLLSGAAVKAGVDYSQGMATDEYGKAYDRYNTNQTNLYNRLSGLAGTGQTAASNLGTLGTNQANAQSDLITGAGNAIAAGQVASGNAWSTGLNGAGSSLASIGSNQALLKLLAAK